MDLIKAIKQVETKDKERNQLLGKKSMLVDSLKELGYKNIEQAKVASEKIEKEVAKMAKHYDEGETKFKTQFAHLLQ